MTTTTTTIRILIIKPGFGGGKDGERFKLLQQMEQQDAEEEDDDDDTSSHKKKLNMKVIMPDIPEPIKGTQDMINGLTILLHEINTFHPDILLAGSRGGIYITELFVKQQQQQQQQDDNGGEKDDEDNNDDDDDDDQKKNPLHELFKIPPIFGIGLLQTKILCEMNNGMHPIVLCHGIHDDRNTIDRVRIDCLTSKVAELIELNDTHSLQSLNTTTTITTTSTTTTNEEESTTASSTPSTSTLSENNTNKKHPLLVILLERFYYRIQSSIEFTKWVNEERPKWIESELKPKIDTFEQQAKEATERALKQRKNKNPALLLFGSRATTTDSGGQPRRGLLLNDLKLGKHKKK